MKRENKIKSTINDLDTFHISLTMEIKAIAGLIPIYLHLRKLSGRNQLQSATFPHNHIIKVLFKRSHIPQSHQ